MSGRVKTQLLPFIAGLAGVAALTLSTYAADATADMKKMDGAWTPVKGELGGRELPAESLKLITLRMKGTEYDVTLGTNPLHDQGTTKINASLTPRAIDIKGTNGPNLGKLIPAIYEFDGDALRICYNLAGTNRPTEFKSAKGTMLYFVTYERKKE